MLVILAKAPGDNCPLNTAADTVPTTDKLFKLPILVIPAKVPDDNWPLNTPADTVPVVDMPLVTDKLPIDAWPLTVKLPAFTLPVVTKLPTSAWLVTDKLLNCPMLVILAKAPGDNCPLKTAADTVPTTDKL